MDNKAINGQIVNIMRLKVSELDEVITMIQAVFDSYVAPDCSVDGIRVFKDFIKPEEMQGRIDGGSLVLVARFQAELAGVIEIRVGDHIALLFTAARFQRQGIAGKLLQTALDSWRETRTDLQKITVNSSPYAVAVYRRLGFSPITIEQNKYGVRFTPMMKIL